MRETGRLAGVEIRRLLARRLFRILILLCLLGIVAAGTITFFQSSKDTGAAVARARVEQRGAVEACMKGEFGRLPGEGKEGFDRRARCEKMVGQFGVEDQRFRLSTLTEVFLGTSVPVAILAWLLAASFVGAEWHAGTMTTLLTWEPRRVRVLLTKAIAAALVLFVTGIVLQVLLGLALTPAAVFRGSTSGLGGSWLEETAGVVVRGSLIATLAGLMGLSVASVGRNTAAAFGVGFGYFTIVENLVRGLRPQWARWMVGDNAGRFILAGELTFPPIERTTLEAGALIALYALVFLLIAVAFFNRRDLT
ncbi:MAG: ABC transporter permease subunit [Actinobacteria bacterium]|nr:ABC transporter permease subunit [Actinomycetota bacterium]